MKFKNILAALAIATLGVSCTDLERYPLDQGSSETWFTNETEFEMAIADLYRPVWWNLGQEAWNDDYLYRKVAGQPIVDGTLNSETSITGYLVLETIYAYNYRTIVRANVILANIERGREAGVSEDKLTDWAAQARFSRAYHYGMLVFYWGDVVYVGEDSPTLEAAYEMSRTPKAEVIEKIYEDFDYAIANLPETRSGDQQACKGAALALKARFALWFGDYDIAADCAKQVIALADKGVYRLNPDFGAYFHARNDKESIFFTPSSTTLGIYPESAPFSSGTSYLPRLHGGTAAKCPSWAILASFECTDGLTIDKSPLFNPKKPFENRDPRCTETLVEFGTDHMGIIYDPTPSVTKVYNSNTGTTVKNQDSYPVGNANASYNGLVWKKRVEIGWGTGVKKPENDQVIIRLADVYLIYAEAMIEQNKIDDSVLEAINKVRARAYKCDVTATADYPAITTKDQTELRRVVRRERRVELAFEQLRYYDIIRWRIAKQALNMPNCGIPSNKTTTQNLEKNGHWFWDEAPTFDDNDIPNFQVLIDKGYCDVHSQGAFSDRMYLWPIPAKELLINSHMTQNPGY